jgi:ferredoxin/flavodoxin
MAVANNVVIFYFSGTGNTWWVAEELCRQLNKKDFNSRAYSIEKITPAETASLIEESTLVGFGYPIHGSDLPQPMKEFIEALPQYPGKDALVFCTQWLWSGDGASLGASMLKEKGYTVKWGEHFLMPNNVSVSVIRLPYTNDPARLSAVRQRAARKISRLVSRITAGKPYRHGFNTLAYLLGCMQRVPYRRYYHRLQNDIAINYDICIDCGDCVRLCPVGNLYYAGEEIKTKGNCILCTRCYNFCPVAAVTYMKRPHLPERGEPYRGPIENFDPSVLTSPQNAF